nr:HAD hydrolase-like protein [Novosphingobium jiangmenense]
MVFDLDGTLVDSNAACVGILREMLQARNSAHTIDDQGARAWMSRGGRDMVRALLGDACRDPDEDLKEFRARYAAYTTPHETVFPGVASGLQRLADAGFAMAICSNKPQALCEKVLHDTGLARHFSAVVGGRPDLPPKPAPDLLEQVLSAHRLVRGEGVFIGDSEIDHAVAADAGMPFHFLTWGYAEAGWSPVGGTVHHSFESLVGALSG